MRSGVIAPLVLKETVLGVLGLVSSAPHAFTPADLRLLESFAHTTTAAIQNATLHNEVQMLAVTDTLTETYNRRGFFEVCQREFERAVRFNRPLAVIMLDLDGFKSVNDTYGHAAGDQALRVLAQRLFTSIREHDYLGRYGGDEFTILLPESDLETASVIAERMRRSLNKPFSLIGSGSEPVTLAMTASLGVADRLGEADFQQLIDRADRAAYTAKRAGGNRVNTG
jgi:diguanylate cyclase (GGDEF)-like protein